ncbi:TOL protein [Pseudoneurospora amorphoporcata]|uniref:TOL protein n=1 Tax=Pseudoneurospora amorphoporcata TaxID=241081 RepID=A0AAN6SC86_9PEZI|nr:TOL protein [Pseudoneurospora amorphoporcata]
MFTTIQNPAFHCKGKRRQLAASPDTACSKVEFQSGSGGFKVAPSSRSRSRSHQGSYEAVLEYFTSSQAPLPTYLQSYDSFVSHFFGDTNDDTPPPLSSSRVVPSHLTSYEAFIRYSTRTITTTTTGPANYKISSSSSSSPKAAAAPAHAALLPLNQYYARCAKALGGVPPPPSTMPWYRWGGHLCTVEELFQSASEGRCHFCWFVMVKVLRRLFVGEEDEGDPGRRRLDEVWGDVSNIKSLWVSVFFWGEDRWRRKDMDVWRGEVRVESRGVVPKKGWEEGKVVVSEFVRLSGFSAGPSYSPSFLTSFHTASEQSWSQALEWINNCRSHPLCNAAEIMDCHDRRPARLIAVGRPGDTHVRVIETARLAVSETPFMSLSHCWGKNGVPTQLLRDNYNRFLNEGIKLTELPRTFRDAIDVTRRLNMVPYIWIDSLCIIQDSKQDWDEESVKMQYVYRNSVLNLAAGASPNSHGGLFNLRHPLSTVPWSIPLQDESDGLILFTRGWVLQEQLLARRTLIFGMEELHWECVTSEASESFPSSIETERWDDLHDRRTIFQHQWENLVSGVSVNISDAKRRKAWELLVQTYFSRSLTKAWDRLVAISGIAEQLGGRWGQGVTYLAGLWSYRLVQGLLWSMTADRCEERDAGAAPSWSWASLVPAHVPGVTDLQLMYEEDEFVDGLAEVLEARVTPARSTNPFGTVVPGSGRIRLRGSVLPRARITNRDGNFEDYDLFFARTVSGSHNIRLDESGQYINVHSGLPNYLHGQSIVVNWDDINDMQEDGEAYLAPLQVQLIEGGPGGIPSALQLVRLVLFKASSISTPQFRRAGLFSITDDAPEWFGDQQRDNNTDNNLDINVQSSSDPEPFAVHYPSPNHQHHPFSQQTAFDAYDNYSESQPDSDSYSSNPFANATWENEAREETKRESTESEEYVNRHDYYVWILGIERLKNQGFLCNIDTWFAQEQERYVEMEARDSGDGIPEAEKQQRLQQQRRMDLLKEDPYVNGPRPLNTNLTHRYSPYFGHYRRIDEFLEVCKQVAQLKPDSVLGRGEGNRYVVYEIV